MKPQGQNASYPLGYTEGPKSRVTEAAEQTMDRLKGTAAEMQHQAEQVAEQARLYGEKAQEVLSQIRPFVDKSLKDHPMATLASAAVIGFVLGALWKK